MSKPTRKYIQSIERGASGRCRLIVGRKYNNKDRDSESTKITHIPSAPRPPSTSIKQAARIIRWTITPAPYIYEFEDIIYDTRHRNKFISSSTLVSNTSFLAAVYIYIYTSETHTVRESAAQSRSDFATDCLLGIIGRDACVYTYIYVGAMMTTAIIIYIYIGLCVYRIGLRGE